MYSETSSATSEKDPHIKDDLGNLGTDLGDLDLGTDTQLNNLILG